MYKNRYGDTVEFIPISDTEIEFKVTDKDGNPTIFWRFGWDEDSEIFNMADPSGGPYIAEGHNMGIEDPQFKGKKVKYITKEDGKFIIHV